MQNSDALSNRGSSERRKRKIYFALKALLLRAPSPREREMCLHLNDVLSLSHCPFFDLFIFDQLHTYVKQSKKRRPRNFGRMAAAAADGRLRRKVK
jgi:hypothetical protein